MGYWKRKRLQAEQRETDIENARAELVLAKDDQRQVIAQAPLVASLSLYLAERRELNHFGDALSASFTPRRNHA